MNTQTPLGTKLTYIIILGGIFIAMLFNITSTFHINLALIACMLSLLFKKVTYIKLNIFDLAIYSIFFLECIHTFFSLDKTNSTTYIIKFSTIILYYTILRILFYNSNFTRKFFSIFTIIIFVLTSLSIISFHFFKSSYSAAGFDSLYEIRSMYRPITYLINPWTSYLILFMGVISIDLYHNRNTRISFWSLFNILTICSITYCMIITFSRGAIIALGLFILFLPFYLRKLSSKRLSSLLVICFALTLLIAILPHRNEVRQTIKLTESSSQQRSISGRTRINKAAMDIFRQNPLTGVGNNGFVLACNDLLFEEDDYALTSYPSNIFYQCLLEKGIILTILWGLLFLVFIIYTIKTKDTLGTIVLCTLIVLLSRELSFSSFFRIAGIQFLVFTLLAIWNSKNKSNGFSSYNYAIPKLGWTLPIVYYLLILCFTLPGYKKKYTNNKIIYDLQQDHCFDCARNKFEEIKTQDIPHLINKSIIHWEIYKENASPEELKTTEQYIIAAIQKNPKDNILRHNLGVLYTAKKQHDKACMIFDDLTQKFPDNSLYHWSASIIYEKADMPEKSMFHLENAIYLNPRLLDKDDIQYKLEHDSLLRKNLYIQIQTDSPTNNKNPIRLAKNGKILLHLKEVEKAEDFLKKALELQPNLVMPWYYLYKISQTNEQHEKAKLYKIKYDIIKTSIHKEEDSFINKSNLKLHLFGDRYILKFRYWYNMETIPDIIFTLH